MRSERLGGGEPGRPKRRFVLSLVVVAFAAALAAGPGCGSTSKASPRVGGESHFLHWCSDSCDEAGLECISGLCTQPCVVAQPNACSAFTNASCTSASIEPGAVAVCDVACEIDPDCAALGGDHHCDRGFCRAPEVSPTGSAERGPDGPSTLSTRAEAGSLQSAGAAGSSELGYGGAGSTPAPGGTGGEGAAAPSCARCLGGANVSWEATGGGLSAAPDYLPASSLRTCGIYEHSRTDGYLPVAAPRCSTSMDCGSPELISLDAILQDPLFVSSDRVEFGRFDPGDTMLVVSLYEADGSLRTRFGIGRACDGASECAEMPAIVATLYAQLKRIDDIALATPPCLAAFPGGAPH